MVGDAASRLSLRFTPGLVAIASAMTGRDFVAEARTLEARGLAGLDVARIVARVR